MARSGFMKRSVNPLAELSLALLQVVSRITLDYGTNNTGFRGVVQEVRLNMHHKFDEECELLIIEVI